MDTDRQFITAFWLTVFALVLGVPYMIADLIALVRHIWNHVARRERADNGAVRRSSRHWE